MNKKSLSKLVSKSEKLILKWLKPFPRLPKDVTKLIANNVWWVVMIMMIVMMIGAFVSLIGIMSYTSFVSNAPSYTGIYNTSIYSGVWLAYMVISLAFSLVMIYLYSKAINPLKMMHAMGWRLLFIAFLVSIVRAVVGAFTDTNVFVIIFSLIFSAIFMTIGAYLLFEIRHHFIKK